MANEEHNPENALVAAVEAAGTAVTEMARAYKAKSGDATTAARSVTPGPPTSELDTPHWASDAATIGKAEGYYQHFRPGGAGNPASEGANNAGLGLLYEFLFAQRSNGEAAPNHRIWKQWQTWIRADLGPLLIATSPDAQAIRDKVEEINGLLHDEIEGAGGPSLTINLGVAQYVALWHVLVTQKDLKLLSPWGETLEPGAPMFW